MDGAVGSMLSGGNLDRYMHGLYENILGQALSPRESRFLGAQAARGATLETLVGRVVGSSKGQAFLVREAYGLVLGRPPAMGEAFQARRLLHRGGLAEVWKALAKGDEFYRLSGGTRSDYVEGLYRTFLGRGPSKAEAAAAGGVGSTSRAELAWRDRIIRGIFASEEFRAYWVERFEVAFGGGYDSLSDAATDALSNGLTSRQGFQKLLAYNLASPGKVAQWLGGSIDATAPLGASDVAISPPDRHGRVNTDPHYGDSILFLQPSSAVSTDRFEHNKNPYGTLELDAWNAVLGQGSGATGDLLASPRFSEFTQQVWFKTESKGVAIVSLTAAKDEGGDYAFPQIYVDPAGMLRAGLFAAGTTEGDLQQADGASRTTDSKGRTLVTYALPNYMLDSKVYVADDQWHNVALVGGDSGRSLNLYIDGTWAAGTDGVVYDPDGNAISGMTWQMLPDGLDEADVAVATALGGGIASQPYGKSWSVLGDGFLGRMDEFRTWNQAMSAAWIAARAADAPGATQEAWPSFTSGQGFGSGASDPASLRGIWYTFDDLSLAVGSTADTRLAFEYRAGATTGHDGWSPKQVESFPSLESTRVLAYDSSEGPPRSRFDATAPMLDVAYPSSIPTAIPYATDSIPFAAPSAAATSRTESRDVYLDAGQGLLMYLARRDEYDANTTYRVQVLRSNPAAWINPAKGTRDIPTTTVADETTTFFTGSGSSAADAPVTFTPATTGYYRIVITRADGDGATTAATQVQVQVVPAATGSELFAKLSGKVTSPSHKVASDQIDWGDRTTEGLKGFYAAYPSATAGELSRVYDALAATMSRPYNHFIIATASLSDYASALAWIQGYDSELNSRYAALRASWAGLGKTPQDLAALDAVHDHLRWLGEARLNLVTFLKSSQETFILNQFDVTGSAARVQALISPYVHSLNDVSVTAKSTNPMPSVLQTALKLTGAITSAMASFSTGGISLWVQAAWSLISLFAFNDDNTYSATVTANVSPEEVSLADYFATYLTKINDDLKDGVSRIESLMGRSVNDVGLLKVFHNIRPLNSAVIPQDPTALETSRTAAANAADAVVWAGVIPAVFEWQPIDANRARSAFAGTSNVYFSGSAAVGASETRRRSWSLAQGQRGGVDDVMRANPILTYLLPNWAEADVYTYFTDTPYEGQGGEAPKFTFTYAYTGNMHSTAINHNSYISYNSFTADYIQEFRLWNRILKQEMPPALAEKIFGRQSAGAFDYVVGRGGVSASPARTDGHATATGAFNTWEIPFKDGGAASGLPRLSKESFTYFFDIAPDITSFRHVIVSLDFARGFTKADLVDFAQRGAKSLSSGEVLERGESVTSPNGRYNLTFAWNGDLTLDEAGVVIWHAWTGRKSSPPSRAYLNNDGRLVVVGPDGSEVFSTPGGGVGPYTLEVSNDGQASIVSADGEILWRVGERVASLGDRLASGSELLSGQRLLSADGRFSLEMQSDGNLVLYSWTSQSTHIPTWSSKTNGRAGSRLSFQPDGRLVIYDKFGQPIWSNGQTRKVGGDYRLVLRNTGDLVAYDGTTEYWSSMTALSRNSWGYQIKPAAVAPMLEWSANKHLSDRGTDAGVQLASNGSTLLSVWSGLNSDRVWYSTSGDGKNWTAQSRLDGSGNTNGLVAATSYTNTSNKAGFFIAWQQTSDGAPSLKSAYSLDGSNWSTIHDLGSYGTRNGVVAAAIGPEAGLSRPEVYLLWVKAGTNEIWSGSVSPTNGRWVVQPADTGRRSRNGVLPGVAYVPGQGLMVSFFGVDPARPKGDGVLETFFIDPVTHKQADAKGAHPMLIPSDALPPQLVVLDGSIYLGINSIQNSYTYNASNHGILVVNGLTWYRWEPDATGGGVPWSTAGENLLVSGNTKAFGSVAFQGRIQFMDGGFWRASGTPVI